MAQDWSGACLPDGERRVCEGHSSLRLDGTLDSCCLRCGADGYWHEGHRHDLVHPSGKVLIRVECPVAV
jgi:hypothetical protein